MSERFYRALLHLYPASFRHDYGPEMALDFARRRRAASGLVGIARLWIAALFEVVGNAAAVHADLLRQDLRYAFRALRRAPGFAVTALLLVALGVGANTAAFSVADFVLLRPLPFPQADRLVRVWETHPGGYSRTEASPANYRDWKSEATSFESLGAYSTQSVNLGGRGDPQRLDGAVVTADLLPTLGVRPLHGRWFADGEDRAATPATVVLSHSLWQRTFGADPGVVGRTIRLDEHPHTIIGVMPRDFQFPDRDTEFWAPFPAEYTDDQDRNNNWWLAVGRLKPAVSIETARSEMDVVAAHLRAQYPADNKDKGINVQRLRDDVPRQSRLLLFALCGASLCVLLIACANLASLLLGRGIARRQELAVRAAIGAGRERIVRQLATEGLLLASLGGVLGIGVAIAAVPLLSRLVPANLPVAAVPTIDVRVLAFAVVVTALTGLAFSIAPAVRASGQTDLSGLHEGARSGGGGKERLRSTLVIAEIAASVVLLASAGLLLRALWTVQSIDPGFRAENVTALRTELPWPRYETVAARTAFFTRVLGEVRGVPGVTSAAYISFLPMVMRGGIWPVIVPGEPEVTLSERERASLRFVTPGFFASLRIPIRGGRDVGDGDTAKHPFVAVVSESFARRHWPGQDPLGRRFTFALSEREIVGVVGDIRVRGFEQESEPQVYVPSGQVADGALIGYVPKDLVVRSNTASAAIVPAIREIVRRADPEQPVSDVRTMIDIVETQTASRRVQSRAIGAFAVVAAVLAAVGIHGLLALSVSQRSRELGVRIALGAQPRDILRMVVRQSLRLALTGIIPGIAIAYALARAMQGLLAGVGPGDPATFLAIVALSLLTTAAGTLVPTLRAVRVDPLEAMRAE